MKIIDVVSEEIKLDLTPMIDVIFNLLIFFMLVTQMVTEERAELVMPIASQAQEEKTGDRDSLIINIHKDSQIEIATKIITWDELLKLLFEESRISADPATGLSNRAVVIRCDVDAPYRTVQQVMTECAKKKIYKISFGARIGE